MKKVLFFSLSTLLISLAAQAQSWNLTGNNNATPTSILGNTNSVPLRLFTKNVARIVIDTFGFVGINSAHPVSTLDVRGTQFLSGILKFGTGSNGIQFANPTTTSNKAMMYMFTSGTANLPRMVIAHSTTYPDWGLQYDDGTDQFNFLSGGTNIMTIDLGASHVNINGTTTINNDALLNSTATIGGIATMNSGALINNQLNVNGNTPPNPYTLYLNHNTFGFGIQENGNANYWELWEGLSNTLHLYFDNNSRGSFDPTTGAYTSVSDARLKTNIKPMEPVLDKINQLKASSYQFKNVKDQQFYDGFIAQDVQKVFPNLVIHDVSKERNLDVYTMNYSGFGVIAIKGIQELQDQIKIQHQDDQNQIQDLRNQIRELKELINKIAPGQLQNVSAGILLEQNFPNPAKNSTGIGYSIPTNEGSAQLLLTDNLGRTIKTIQLNASGRINLDVSTLSNGTYTYSLIVNGKIVDTKKLIKAAD